MEYLIDKSTLDLKELGIDELISPESLAAREVKYILKSPALTEVFNFHTRELYMMGLTLEEGAPIVNKTVAEVSHLVPCNSFMVVAAYRNGQTIIPNGNFKYLTGDHLYFVSNDEGKNKVLDYAGKKNGVIKNLLIIGGSRTGKYMALRMRKYYNIKLIEKDIDRCRYLAELIPGVQIVHGDATNLDLLKEEGLEEFDAIAAVTGNSETNILSCLLAKEAGVKKNIAMIENIALFEYTQKMGIDTLINKKLAAANFILRHIIKGRVLSYLYGVDAEIHEYVVPDKKDICGLPIRALNFPENALITGVIRNQKGFITLGDFRLMPGDKAYVFSLPQSSKNVQSFFKQV